MLGLQSQNLKKKQKLQQLKQFLLALEPMSMLSLLLKCFLEKLENLAIHLKSTLNLLG